MKRARSKLLRRLAECEDISRALDDQKKDIRYQDRDAGYAQHLVLDDGSMANFLRYAKPRTNANCTAPLPN